MNFRRNNAVEERMVPGFCVIFLVLVSLTADVTGQTIVLEPFNRSLTTSSCANPRFVLEGERIVLTAVLNASQTKLSDWPLNKILLISDNTQAIICQVDIERDQCRGLRPDLCGYCDYNHGSEYHLIFNITANATEWVFRCSWLGSSNSTNSTTVYAGIIETPMVKTTVTKNIDYSVKNITTGEFILNPGVPYIYIDVRPYSNCAVRYGRDSVDQPGYYYMSYSRPNVTVWDEHIGDTLDLKCQDYNCGTNFTLTVPVLERPTVVCDYPTLTRSNLLGTQVSFSCTVNTLWKFSSQNCYIKWPNYSSVAPTVLGDRWTCLFPNVSADIATSPYPTNVGVTFYFYLDGPGRQVPMVQIFKVNSLSSVAVDIGTDLNFECKVYGDPMATAVLIGPGRRGRVQESRSQTDLLNYTLTSAQCQDSGRYMCKGVNSVGTTPRNNQVYVDVIVKCPTTIIDFVPREKNNRVTFDHNSDVIITLEVIGYPAPNQFSVRVQNGSTFSNVSQEEYSIKYVELSPTRGLINLLMPSDGGQRSGLYVLTFSNGYNTSTDFRFDFGQFESDQPVSESASPWLYAFIAVICVLGVIIIIIIVIIIICCVKKHPRKKQGERDFDDVKFGQTTVGNTHQQQTQQLKVPKSGPPTIHSVQSDNQQYESMSSSRSTGNDYQQPKSTPSTQQVKVTKPDPPTHQPTTTDNPPYANTDSTEDENIYENAAFETSDNPEYLYELAG